VKTKVEQTGPTLNFIEHYMVENNKSSWKRWELSGAYKVRKKIL